MRTLLFLLVGFLLLAACALLGRLFSSNYAGATYAAILAFVVLWLVISTANLWVGVAKAGYTLSDEFPIFLVIFGAPTVAAIFLKWRGFFFLGDPGASHSGGGGGRGVLGLGGREKN